MSKIILIAPKDQLIDYYAVCEYDDYLLCAHLTADSFSKKIKCKVTDLHYSIIEKINQFSIMCSGTKSVSFGNNFDFDISRAMIKNDVKWHDFEQIDTDQYAKIIFNGQPTVSVDPF
jgi:hypothetical protein